MHPRRQLTQISPVALQAYDYTRLHTRSCWAWEFLRRDANYCSDWLQSRAGHVAPIRLRSDVKVIRIRKRFSRAEAWGLCSFRGSLAERT